MILGLQPVDLYDHPRHHQPDRDRHRLHRGVRHDDRQTARPWNAIFLWITIAHQRDRLRLSRSTDVTPGIIVGIISLVFLAVALFALYVEHLAGAWRWIYVVSAIVALWFNVFVLIVQSFQKIAALKALAPTQSEPPFQIAQAVALVLFVVLAIFAVRKFRPVAA